MKKIYGNENNIVLAKDGKFKFLGNKGNILVYEHNGEVFERKVFYNDGNNLLIDNEIEPGPIPPKPEEKLIIDGLEYRTVKMPDGRIWMAENLQVAEGNAPFYENDEATYGRNGKNYGRLYTRSEAVDAAAKVEGWHVPSKEEWEALADAVGGLDVAGTKLKSATEWRSGLGTDDYGFSVFPAGYGHPWGFDYVQTVAYVWTASDYSSTEVFSVNFSETNSSMRIHTVRKTDNHFSVRLIKDI